MKKVATWLLLVCAAFLVQGAEVKMDGFFRSVDGKGNLKEWVLHPWSGFKPFAGLSLKKETSTRGNIVQIRSVKGSSGMVIRSKGYHAGVSGDTVRVTVRVRGKGKGSACLYQYTSKGRKWNPALPSARFNLSSKWETYVFSFRLTNGFSGETGFYQICLGCSKGSEMDVMYVTADHEKGKFKGEVKIPREWTVFGPVNKNYEPTQAELNSIPKTLDAQKGKKIYFSGNKLDFAPALGGKGAKKCGWAFVKLTSVTDQECTLAAGADWWMKVYVNGKPVIDTLKTGNAAGKVQETPYIKNVRLKKGVNILAVKIITGIASSDFYLRNASSLRSMGGNIRLHKISWIENFDTDKIQCSGKFTRIQGHPTPGLLTMTGQAMFQISAPEQVRTPSSVKLAPPAEDQYAVTGVRIQSFGRETRLRKDGSLSLNLIRKNKRFSARIVHKANSDLLSAEILSGSQILAVHKIPYRVLPADFIFGGDIKGRYVLQVNSLADSSSRCFRGTDAFFTLSGSLRSFLEVAPAKKGSSVEVVVDNFLCGTAVADSKELHVPFTIQRKSTFDPVKAGWKKIFEDDFNGDKLDESKWTIRGRKDRFSIKDGILKITADWGEGKNKNRLQSVSLYTKKPYLYGYFEAKVRFRRQSGWWSAFWLCSLSPSNPYADGFEIDIYEDYYLSKKTADGPYGNTLDHNVHFNVAGTLKSFNYHSILPGTLDDYYVIGCKWTPFEISYYINGRLMRSQANHSPYDSVTFDKFHHGNGIQPLYAILSGCCGASGGNPALGKFPDHFTVDYVRIYEFPRKDLPEISVKTNVQKDFIISEGSTLKFNAQVKTAKGSTVKAVYLMDSGFLLDYKTKPPYTFDLPLTREYFDTTHFVKPGRNGQRPEYKERLHAWSVFVQDSKGRVAFTEPIIRYVGGRRKSTAYKGKPAVIPGTVYMGRYDEGGQNVAYYDTTSANVFSKTYRVKEGVDVGSETGSLGGVFPGEWLNFTVDVKQSGTYTVKFHYGTPMQQVKPIYLLSGKRVVGEFHLKKHKATHWGVDTISTTKVRLEKGRQTLKLFFLGGPFNATKLEFIPDGK